LKALSVYDNEGRVYHLQLLSSKGTQRGNCKHQQFQLTPGNYTLKRFCTRRTPHTGKAGSARFKKCNYEDYALIPQGSIESHHQRWESPAYEIIRRDEVQNVPFMKKQVKALKAGVCSRRHQIKRSCHKRVLRTRNAKDEDRDNNCSILQADGIIYLSVGNKISMEQPDEAKLEVISGRESGNNGFGFNFPAIISFYETNVNMFASKVNPRGCIAITDGASLYKYKFLGSKKWKKKSI